MVKRRDIYDAAPAPSAAAAPEAGAQLLLAFVLHPKKAGGWLLLILVACIWYARQITYGILLKIDSTMPRDGDLTQSLAVFQQESTRRKRGRSSGYPKHLPRAAEWCLTRRAKHRTPWRNSASLMTPGTLSEITKTVSHSLE